MRVFDVMCKDRVTGYQMVACECSYNQALELLQIECKKHGRNVYGVEKNDKDSQSAVIYTGKPTAGTDFNGNPDIWFADQVMFYYDELRGFLMKM